MPAVSRRHAASRGSRTTAPAPPKAQKEGSTASVYKNTTMRKLRGERRGDAKWGAALL